MPVQIQNDVTADYEPVITIADTGEVLTEAQIYDTTLALANRIEYVRSLTPQASPTPEAFVTLREEFFGAIWNSTQARLDADLLWRTSHTGSPAIGHDGGEPQRPGQLVCSMPPSSEFYFGIGGFTDGPFGAISFDRVSFTLAVTDDVANVASQVVIGLKQDWHLANGGTNALQLYYSITDPNWRLFIRRASVSTIVDLGVPVVYGNFVTCRFIKNGNDIDIELNGSIVHTVASGSGPTGNLNFGGAALSSVAETEVLEARFDIIDILTSVSTGSRAD